jgi:hypothetical protein
LLLIGIMNITKSRYIEPRLILRLGQQQSLLCFMFLVFGSHLVLKNKCSHTRCPFVYDLIWLCSQSARVLQYMVPHFDAAVLAKRVQMLRTSNKDQYA